tara:strand:- start:75 stop:338 length:264 start_codon:yes stop_codon:yes gene_type:complete
MRRLRRDEQKKVNSAIESLEKTSDGRELVAFLKANPQSASKNVVSMFHDLVNGEISTESFLNLLNIPKIPKDYIDEECTNSKISRQK